MTSEELLSTLVKLSRIDDYFDQMELTFLIKIGDRLGLGNNTVEHIIKNPKEGAFKPPKSEQDRMNILYYMLFLMKIDTVISEPEKEMVYHYGFKLGFSKPMLEDFISLVEQHKFKPIPSEKMIEVIRKYQN
jgi:uncharacterized membrane protein YebE (DUF533 family)